MNKEIMIQIFFMLAGVFSFLGACFEWNLFFSSRKAQRVIKIFGRQGARIFYMVIGVILFSIALLDLLNVIDIHLMLTRRVSIR